MQRTAPPQAPGRRILPRGAFIAAALLTVALALAGGGYGFHRDELYFIEAGLHPAWGYPDQPAAAPLLAAGVHWSSVGRCGVCGCCRPCSPV